MTGKIVFHPIERNSEQEKTIKKLIGAHRYIYNYLVGIENKFIEHNKTLEEPIVASTELETCYDLALKLHEDWMTDLDDSVKSAAAEAFYIDYLKKEAGSPMKFRKKNRHAHNGMILRYNKGEMKEPMREFIDSLEHLTNVDCRDIHFICKRGGNFFYGVYEN